MLVVRAGARAAAPIVQEKLGGAAVAGIDAADHPVWLSELHGQPNCLKLATASWQQYGTLGCTTAHRWPQVAHTLNALKCFCQVQTSK